MARRLNLERSPVIPSLEAPVLPTNFRLGWNPLKGTSRLAYYVAVLFVVKKF
jgi:hypothetical protein